MRISSVGVQGNYSKPSFRAKKEEKYENPINRKTERNLSILGTVGSSLAAGAVASGLATCFLNEASKTRYAKAGAIGGIVAAGIMALTLPAKLYDTKVSSFTREKEMDVFSRDKELKSNLLEQIDEQAKDKDIPLEEKINTFAQFQMATNGKGLLVKGN